MSEKKGQIAHLDHDPKNNEQDNLAYLCFNHHDQYDSTTKQSKNLTIGEVKHYKELLLAQVACSPPSPVTSASPSPVTTPVLSQFPIEITAAVQRLAPGYRLPSQDDIRGDWAENLDTDDLSPLMTTGEFTGRVATEYAFFILEGNGPRYKIVVLTETAKGDPLLIELETQEGSPQNRYIETVDPGKYSVSPVIWKHEGPKTFSLSRQALIVGTYESAACIYHWDNERSCFLQQWLTD